MFHFRKKKSNHFDLPSLPPLEPNDFFFLQTLPNTRNNSSEQQVDEEEIELINRKILSSNNNFFVATNVVKTFPVQGNNDKLESRQLLEMEVFCSPEIDNKEIAQIIQKTKECIPKDLLSNSLLENIQKIPDIYMLELIKMEDAMKGELDSVILEGLPKLVADAYRKAKIELINFMKEKDMKSKELDEEAKKKTLFVRNCFRKSENGILCDFYIANFDLVEVSWKQDHVDTSIYCVRSLLL